MPLPHPLPVTTAAAAGATLALLAGTSAAGATNRDLDDAAHCVVEVTGQTDTGRYTLSEPACYPTLAEALASTGADIDPGEQLGESDVASGQLAARAGGTLGIHYDGSNRGGASITVTGADCGGGYVNLSADWVNRISSTANNCGIVRFFDGYDKSGSFEQTTPSTWNLGAMNNASNSISYGS
jgi:hypothetical protein